MTLVRHANIVVLVCMCVMPIVVLAIHMLPTMSLPLGAWHIFMRAVEKVMEEVCEVESQYTSATVKTAQALQDWWKKQ